MKKPLALHRALKKDPAILGISNQHFMNQLPTPRICRRILLKAIARLRTETLGLQGPPRHRQQHSERLRRKIAKPGGKETRRLECSSSLGSVFGCSSLKTITLHKPKAKLRLRIQAYPPRRPGKRFFLAETL